jgi:sec-independent protein translocase protein TatA
MGPVGWPEMVVIFLVALLLFGPKKLPELGRTLGKALTEFRRAQSELKSTFEREMRNLERENESLKEITSSFQPDYSYNYDYSSYDSGSYGESNSSAAATEPHDSTVTNASTNSASATEGAESATAVSPEGVIARQAETETAVHGAAHEIAAPESESVPHGAHPGGGSSMAEHNA